MFGHNFQRSMYFKISGQNIQRSKYFENLVKTSDRTPKELPAAFLTPLIVLKIMRVKAQIQHYSLRVNRDLERIDNIPKRFFSGNFQNYTHCNALFVTSRMIHLQFGQFLRWHGRSAWHEVDTVVDNPKDLLSTVVPVKSRKQCKNSKWTWSHSIAESSSM